MLRGTMLRHYALVRYQLIYVLLGIKVAFVHVLRAKDASGILRAKYQ